MKPIYKDFKLVSAFILTLFFFSCDKKLTETNISPNALNAEQVDPGFVMTDVLSRSAMEAVLSGFGGNTSQCIIDATMQYVQQDNFLFRLNRCPVPADVSNLHLSDNSTIAYNYQVKLSVTAA